MSDQIHDCYTCKFRGNIPGDTHKSCSNKTANVEGHKIGLKNGWFIWPLAFDPRWVVSCDGYIKKLIEE